jgi:hypothetical protein
VAPAKNKKALQLIFLQQHSMDWRLAGSAVGQLGWPGIDFG